MLLSLIRLHFRKSYFLKNGKKHEDEIQDSDNGVNTTFTVGNSYDCIQ